MSPSATSTSSSVDFDAPSKSVLSPSALAHVVLRTNDLKRLRDFYLTFLGAKVSHENDILCFMSYDYEHHRIALIQVEGTAAKNQRSCGLEHIAFSFPTLTDLMLSYRQRLAAGIKPIWAVNHGPTTSLYYRDPDGNTLETQVDNFETAEEANEFMLTPQFHENPIGVDFDPEELIKKLRDGESDESLKRRPETGPRKIPEAML